jgi:site-specific DNA-cytosine methylase
MIALDRLGIEVTNYFASEIDKAAIKVSKHNWGDKITHIGDVTKISYENGVLCTEVGDFEVEIDLIIGGSPCQSISNLGDGSGLDGKSGLFYKYLELKNAVVGRNPKAKFLLENVVGNKKAIQEISKEMGVQGVLFNSNLLSAQNRARYYWTNITFDLPSDQGILLKDILEEGAPEDSILTPGRARWIASEKGKQCIEKRYAVIDPIKANCLTARSDASWNSNYVTREGQLTRLTPIEYERLQTVQDNYTASVRNSERYKILGNGWTVDVICHILRGLK